MTDWEHYEMPSSDRSGWWKPLLRLLLMVAVGGGLLWALFASRAKRANDLMVTFAHVRQVPAGRPLPTNWARRDGGNVVRYYTPPVEADVCSKVTDSDFKLPPGVSVDLMHGTFCGRSRHVLVFTVPKPAATR